MDMCYITNHPDNALILGMRRTGLLMQDYDKEGDRIYPLHDGKRTTVDENNMVMLKDEFILGDERIVSSMIQLYNDYEIKVIEFELFCDVLMKEGENELFRRSGTDFVCKRRDMYERIKSKVHEHELDEVVFEYPVEDLHRRIMDHPLLSDKYLGTIAAEGISWIIFDRVSDGIVGLDMDLYEMLFTDKIWYNFSNILEHRTDGSERFIFAYEIITGTSDPYMEGYDGMRISSSQVLDSVMDVIPQINKVMGEFDVFTTNSLLDALRIRYRYYDMRSRVFRSGSGYVTLVHGYTTTRKDNVDAFIRSDIISHLSTCKNDEDPVSLEKFNDLDLLDLVHIVPHDEDGFKFCFSDEYELDINPYTRRQLSKKSITLHYHSLFTRPIVV